MTAEELQQRLDGAKERVSSQPHTEQRSQAADSGERQSSSGEGEERGTGGRRGAGMIEGKKATLSHLFKSGFHNLGFGMSFVNCLT